MANVIEAMPGGRWRVFIDERTRQWAWRMAKSRNERAGGPRNERADRYGLDHVQAHYVGVLGEVGFAIWHGIPLGDIQLYKGHGDDGIDFRVMSDADTWQVKGTMRFKEPLLWIGQHEKMNATFYACVAYQKPNTLDLVGWATLDEVVAAPVEKVRGDPKHVLHEGRLHRFLIEAPDPPDPPYGKERFYGPDEREWIIRFERTTHKLPPHGIGPFNATPTEAEARLVHVGRVNPDLSPVLMTRVDEPPRQPFSTRYMFTSLEGTDNAPWWIEWEVKE